MQTRTHISSKSQSHPKNPSHKKSLSKIDGHLRLDLKTDMRIKYNNNEISQKLLEAKERPYLSSERTPSSYNSSTDFFKKIPRLDLKKIQKIPKKLEGLNSQRSVSKSIGDDGFCSQRPIDEYMIKPTKIIIKEALNDSEEGLQHDLSHILDKKNKKIPKKTDGFTVLGHLGGNNMNNKLNINNNDEKIKMIKTYNEGNFNKTDGFNFLPEKLDKTTRKNELFTEIFDILEKEDQDPESIPTFFLLKDPLIIKSDLSSNITIDRFSFLQDLMSSNASHNYSHVFLNKMLEDLKRNHPNLFTNSPSGRKDVLILKDWLFATLKSIFSSSEIQKKEKFVIADEAFNLCVNEIIRQISFDCLERGELIAAIWRNYLSFFTKVLKLEVQQKERLQEEQENEYLKHTKIYREQLEEKEKALRGKVEIIEKLKVDLVVLKNEVEQWKKIERKNSEQTEKMRKISDQLLIKCKKLRSENEALRFNMTKYREESTQFKMTTSVMINQKGSQKSLFSSPSKLTFEEVEEKSENSDKESETDDKNLKDIMKLLGEGDELDNEKENERGNLDNPIIVKCFQEHKEKILFVKSTEMDPDIRASYYHNKGIQTDLALADEKFDNVLSVEVLEETMKERDIKKNMLQFKVDHKRESIKRFSSVVEGVKKRASIVSELLNCLSPTKKPIQDSKVSLSRVTSRKNSINDDSSIDSIKLETKDQIVNMNFEGNKSKAQETVEIKVELPSKAKTVLEKRNSLIYELSKKIVGPKSSVFKKIDLEEKESFNFKFEEVKENTMMKFIDEENNNHLSLTLKSSENLATRENMKTEANDNNNNNTSLNINTIRIPTVKDETPLTNITFTDNFAPEKTGSNKKLVIETKFPHKTPKNKNENSNPKTPKSGIQINNINSIHNIKNDKSRRPSQLISEKKNATSTSIIPKNNATFNPNRLKSRKNVIEKEESPQNKMKSNMFSTFKPEIKHEVSPKLQEDLREKIKEQNAAEFLANYLGSSIDRILENSNEKQPISVVLPKSIISNLNVSNPNCMENPENFENYYENENIDEELKNKILDIIQIFQVETQKNDDLVKLIQDLKTIFNTFIEFIKKILIYIKEKSSHPEKYDEFYKNFLEIRAKIPKNFDMTYEQELKENLRRKIIKKTRNITKFFLVPKLGNQVAKGNVIDKENHPGMVITKKIQELGKFKNTNKLLHQKQALKVISQIYDEKLTAGRDNPQNKELEMQIFAFNIFLNRYGIKKVAERKFTEFVLTIKNYLHIFRINVFAKMLNILDSKLNYSVDEMKKYIEGFEYLTEISTNGINILHDPSDIKRYVPYIRGLDFIRVFSENKLSHEEIADLRKELDNLKENDPKNINKNGIIDLDLYLTKILAKYRHIMNRTKTYVVNAFNACDLDGNKMCNLSEFVLLYRHIEKMKFKEEDVVKLFEEQADLINDSQKNMSFDKFTAICVDHQLFSDFQQIKFLGVEENEDENKGLFKEIQKKFDDLQMNWNARKIRIDGKLMMLKSNLEKEDYENWKSILDALEGRVLKKQEGAELKPILIAYKIMDDELERILKKKEELEEYEEVDVEEEN